MDCDASKAIERWTAGGISLRNWGSSRLTLSTTSTVLVPGWRWMARITARLLLYQAVIFVVIDAIDHVAQFFQAHRACRCARPR